MRDYALFLDAIACEGVGHTGKKILSPEMIHLWRANQLGMESRKSYASPGRLGYSYGLGVRTRVDLSQGPRTCLGEFGWGGAAGATIIMDTELRLGVFFAQHTLNPREEWYQPRLRNVIYGCL